MSHTIQRALSRLNRPLHSLFFCTEFLPWYILICSEHQPCFQTEQVNHMVFLCICVISWMVLKRVIFVYLLFRLCHIESNAHCPGYIVHSFLVIMIQTYFSTAKKIHSLLILPQYIMSIAVVLPKYYSSIHLSYKPSTHSKASVVWFPEFPSLFSVLLLNF